MRKLHYVTNNAYSGLVLESDGHVIGLATDDPATDCRALLRTTITAAGAELDDWDLGLTAEDEASLVAQQLQDEGWAGTDVRAAVRAYLEAGRDVPRDPALAIRAIGDLTLTLTSDQSLAERRALLQAYGLVPGSDETTSTPTEASAPPQGDDDAHRKLACHDRDL